MNTKILVISSAVPEPDKASGELRFYTILNILAKHATVTFAVRDLVAWRRKSSDPARYELMLAETGVTLHTGNVHDALKLGHYDVVLFEFYQPAAEYTELARYLHPSACIVVDSVDVHFNRFEAKARLTGAQSDWQEAEAIRTVEMTTYANADLVVAVSEDDRRILMEALPKQHVTVLPNVHAIHESPESRTQEPGRIVFVGAFRHEPNVDAMLYFVHDVMPLIRRRVQHLHLTIIGSHPPPEILALAHTDVEVLGYVPETAPYLRSASISVAPLRYGGGMKGKVGEAMSFSLPVVTTRFGAEGFGLEPGRHLLVADNAEAFADAVARVLGDPMLAESLGRAGHEFIRKNYSPQAMEQRLVGFLALVESIKPAAYPFIRRLAYHARVFYQRHVGWRLGRS